MCTVLLTSQSGTYGGVERRLLSETRALRDVGANVLVSVPNFPGVSDFRRSVRAAGGRPIKWNPYKFIERQHAASFFAQVNKISTIRLSSMRIAFASVLLPWTTVGLSRAWSLQSAGIPFVLSFRATYPRARISEGTRYRIKQALGGMVGAYGVSATANESFIDNFGDLIPSGLSMPVIRNGVDLGRFKFSSASASATRQNLGLTDRDFVVVACGRLDPNKRPGLVLEAFRTLLARVDRARLVMIGRGSLRDRLLEQARSFGIVDRLRMVPFTEDVPAIYSASDTYVCAGLNEGSPAAAIEALAVSLPVIVNDDAPNREIFADCDSATFVAANDPVCWAEAMRKIADLEASARSHLRSSARAFAESSLGEEQMLLELRKYYGELLDKYSGRVRGLRTEA